MDPIAFHLGPLTIRWYGVFAALGFLAGYFVLVRRTKTFALPPEAPSDICFAAVLGGIGGARLLYVIQFWNREFRHNLWEIVKIHHGGLVFFGGFLGAAALIVLLTRRRGWSPARVGDWIAPALPIGHAFGRVGCFLNGCCFGRPWHGPAAVTYPAHTADGADSAVLYVQRQLGETPFHATNCQPVFPIQLVAAAANLALGLALLHLTRRPDLKGKLFPLYLVAYGMLRFLVEFGRGDYLKHTAGLTPAQWLALPIAAAGVIWFLLTRPQRAKPAGEAKA